jgi:hypothetical protein
MNPITETEITFENPTEYRRGSHCQDIVARGKIIGCLIERERGWLQPIETIHQVCVPEAKADKCERWVESEDAGYIMAMFEEFDAFLSFYNAEVLPEIDFEQLYDFA